ncbi:hypothetical protein ABEB36_003285 [Hypothenemus hampei]|uniref:Uncharacterized protein n=1 Tax=Hypothenemus hampei TaxID=57062 RepID=A0ABD1F8M8_HYPHA
MFHINKALVKKIRTQSDVLSQRKYILLAPSGSNISQIFQRKAMNFVSNVLVIESQPQRKITKNKPFHTIFRIWTHQFVGLKDNNKPYLLDQWFSANSSFLHGKELFCDKLKNLHRKTLRIGCLIARPYVMEVQDSGKMTGLDIKLITTILEKLNATLEIVSFQKNGLWGHIFPNGTSDGIKGAIYQDSVDVGIAGFYSNQETTQHFAVSVAYALGEITCLVPKPILASPWMSPYYAFSSKSWLLLVITYTVLALMVYKIYMYQNEKKSKIEICAVIVKPLISQPIAKKDYYYRPLMSLVLVATIALTVAYNAGSASAMAKPLHENSIKTVMDFLNSNIPWFSMQAAEWLLTWKNDSQEIYRRAARRHYEKRPEELRELSKDGRHAFKIEKVHGRHNIDPYIKPDIIEYYQPMKENLHTEYIAFLLRKHSIYLHMFNSVTNRLMQSGITKYWAQETFDHEEFHIRKYLQTLNGNLREVVILKMSHFLGAFSIYLIGNFIALIIFILEIFK